MKFVIGTLLLILVLLQMRLWSGAGSLAEIDNLETAIATQTGENTGLQARNQALMDEVSDLKNGLDSIEERARSDLGLIKKGETFYLIVDDKPAPVQIQEPEIAPVFEAPPEIAPDLSLEAAQELPTEIEQETNPYLEIFSDGDEVQKTEQQPTPAIPVPQSSPQGFE